jgi:phage I-like protein
MSAVTYEAHPVVTGPWDGDAATSRLRAWASSDGTGAKDTLDWSRYRAGFAWHDADATEDFGSYRLPHHDVADGALVTSRRGVIAALAALSGARGGVSIPAEDVADVRAHLEQHADAWRELRVRAPGLALAANAGTTTGGPVWNQIARIGTFKGHPAGEFALTADTLRQIVGNFARTQNRRVPVDYEHMSETLPDGVATTGAPAVAWVVDLAIRSDGLWAAFEWCSDAARAQVRAGQYRYLSPALTLDARHPETGESLGARLTSVALTNHPFLDGMQPVAARAVHASLSPDAVHVPAAVANPNQGTLMLDPRIYQLLGLPPDAAPEAVCAAIEALAKEAAEMRATRDAMLRAEAEGLVLARVTAGQLAEVARPHAVALCLANRQAFDALFPEPAPTTPVAPALAAVLALRVAGRGSPPPPPAAPVEDPRDGATIDALAERILAERRCATYEDAVDEAARLLRRRHDHGLLTQALGARAGG